MGAGAAFVLGIVVAGGCIAGWEYLERHPEKKPRLGRSSRGGGSSRAPTRWKARGPGYYALLYNYPPGDRDRRLKGFAGPFGTRVEADKAADRNADTWYPTVRKLVNDPTTLGM